MMVGMILLLGAAGGYVYWRGQPVPAVTNAAADVMTVSVISPQEQTLDRNIHVSGVIVAREDVVVTAEISAVRITDVLVDEGEWVKKGQPLARLDSSSLQNQLAQLDAQYKEARDNFRRVDAIRQSGAISPSEIDQKRAAFDAAKALREDALLKLKHATLDAPASGLVYERDARIGAQVGGNEPLFRIAQDGHTELEASASEADAALLKTGQSVRVTMPGQTQSVAGTIRLLSPRVDNATRTAKLRVALPEQTAIPIGSFAEAEILTGQSTGLVLPQTAISLDQGTAAVWIVDEASKVHAHPVTVIYRDGDRVMVDQVSLTGSEKIVAKAAAFMHEGDNVAIAPAAKATETTP